MEKTQQRKHKYKQAKTTTKSITAIMTLGAAVLAKYHIYNHLCSPNLIMYYNLLLNWQKPFTVEMYRKINSFNKQIL